MLSVKFKGIFEDTAPQGRTDQSLVCKVSTIGFESEEVRRTIAI